MSWREVARLTFLSHARSPWGLILLIVTLIPAAAMLIARNAESGGPVAFSALSLFDSMVPTLEGHLGFLVTAILLARVTLAYRGAWLLEPEGARQRVPGFFAGTMAAVALALLPWGIASAALLSSFGDGTLALRIAFQAWLGTVLLAGAWVALVIFVCVLVEDLEARLSASLLAWALLALAVPAGLALAHAFAGTVDPPFGDTTPVPAWALPLDLLSPWRIHALFIAASAPEIGFSSEPSAYEATYPALFHPLTFVAVLLLWAAVPLVLATRMQMRRGGDAPAPEVAP